MSWVKVDDRAPEHRKQIAAGPVACWLWVCGLAYCNRQPARDGFMPAAVLPMLCPIPGIAKHADKLVSVGLWERCEGGFLVHDYHDFQLAKPDAEELAVKRSAAGRRGGISSGVVRRHQSAEATDEAKTKQVASSKPPLLGNPLPLLSLSSSVLSFPERSSSKTSAQAREGQTGEGYVVLREPLTNELRATASMATVQDIDGAWLKFCGHYAGQWIHIAGKWQHWCVNEAKLERTERERARSAKQNGPADVADYYNSPDAVRSRERLRAREDREAKAGAASPRRVADSANAVLAMISGKSPSSMRAERASAERGPSNVDVRQPLTEAEREAKRQAGIDALGALNGGAK